MVTQHLSLTLHESGRHTTLSSFLRFSAGVVGQVGLVCALTVAGSYVEIAHEAPLSERPTFLAPLLQDRPRPVQENLSYAALGGTSTPEPATSTGVIRDATPSRDLIVTELPEGGDNRIASEANNEELSRTFSEIEVDSAASRDPGSAGPEYPPSLMATRVEGSVLATFVVDTTGRPDLATYIALESSHPLFSLAVRDALPRMKFRPAKRGSVPVRQQVELRFSFRVVKPPPAAPPPKKPPHPYLNAFSLVALGIAGSNTIDRSSAISIDLRASRAHDKWRVYGKNLARKVR